MKLRVFTLPLVSILLLALAGVPPTSAQATAQKELLAEAEGSVTIAGKKVDYRSVVGKLAVKDMTGNASANIVYTSYIKKTDGKLSDRPLMFCFNGGPGTSSVFVHLGLFGPRRVLMNDDGLGAPEPIKMIDNEFSMLDLADL